MRRPALANPTRNLRWSIEVEPNWLETTSSTAASRSSRSSPMSESMSFLPSSFAAVMDSSYSGSAWFLA